MTSANYILACIQCPLTIDDISTTISINKLTSPRSIVCSWLALHKIIYSDKFILEHQASYLFLHFLGKHYPFDVIHNEFRKVSHIDGDNLLKYSHETYTYDIPNVHDLNLANKKFNYDAEYLWRMFAKSTSTDEFLLASPIIEYWLPPNHRHILIHSKVNYTSIILQDNF